MNTNIATVAELDKLAGENKTASATSSPSTGSQEWTIVGALLQSRSVALPVGFAIGVILLWEFLVWVTNYPRAILPPPSGVLASLVENRMLLLENIPATAGVALGGFLIATVAGVAIAVIMTWSHYLKDAFYPNIVAFQIVPKVAWAPMFVLWLGIETESRLGFATFISIFPIIISMTAGLSNTDDSLLKLCRALTASKWQMLVNVRFPYSLPYLFSAMKISITLAMIGVIVGEFITSQEGLGYVILIAAGRAETDLMLASVLVLCVIGLAFYGLVELGTLAVKRWFGQ